MKWRVPKDILQIIFEYVWKYKIRDLHKMYTKCTHMLKRSIDNNFTIDDEDIIYITNDLRYQRWYEEMSGCIYWCGLGCKSYKIGYGFKKCYECLFFQNDSIILNNVCNVCGKIRISECECDFYDICNKNETVVWDDIDRYGYDFDESYSHPRKRK